MLYDKFKSTKYGKHYLFNKNNERVFSAENYIPYDAGVKRYLQLAVNNRQFHISEFIEEKQNIKKMPIFDQIRTYMEQENRDHLLIGMIYSFCESCASGLLIETLKELNSTIGWKKAVIIILSMEYTEADIEILKSQFRIDFPILIASRGLNERWREIIEEYSKNDVNNIVFAVDRSGNIVRVLDQICQSCTRTFWKWIYNQQRKKGEAVDSR